MGCGRSVDINKYSENSWWLVKGMDKQGAKFLPALSDDFTEEERVELPIKEDQENADVDVFYVPPGPRVLDNIPGADNQAKIKLILNEASCFNNSALIYSPRYQPGKISDYKKKNGGGLNQAYSDIRMAFKYYLDNYNDGRAFILAGHSQGGEHLVHLIKEFIVGKQNKALREKLVCAYVGGVKVGNDTFADDEGFGIELSRNKFDTQTVIAWSTCSMEKEKRGTHMAYGKAGAGKCEYTWFTNESKAGCSPVTWTLDETTAFAKQHMGCLINGVLEPRMLESRLSADGTTLIKDEKIKAKVSNIDGDYNPSEFSLWWLDIRMNAAQRVKSWRRRSLL